MDSRALSRGKARSGLLEALLDLLEGGHELRNQSEAVVDDDFHREDALDRAHLEIRRKGRDPTEDPLGHLPDLFLVLVTIGRLDGLLAELVDGAASGDSANELTVERHVVLRMLPLLDQGVHEGLDVTIVLKPDLELDCCSLSDESTDDHRLEIDRRVLRGLVQSMGRVGPASRAGTGVAGGVSLDRLLAEPIGVSRDEPDHERIQAARNRPGLPGLILLLQLEHHATVRQSVTDRLAEGAFIRQIACGNDGSNGQLIAVDLAELEQLQARVLKLLLGLVDLIHDEDEILVRMILPKGKEVRACVLDRLDTIPLHDGGKAEKIGSLKDAEVEIDRLLIVAYCRLLSNLGLSNPSHPENHQVGLGGDGVVESALVHLLVQIGHIAKHCVNISSGLDCPHNTVRTR